MLSLALQLAKSAVSDAFTLTGTDAGVPENDDDWEGLAAAVYRAVLQMLPASAMSWFGSLRDRSLAVATEVKFCTTQPCTGNMGISNDLVPQSGILTSSNGHLPLYTDNEWKDM